jgi:hypothetical protein
MNVHREFVRVAAVEDGLVRDEDGIGVTTEGPRSWSTAAVHLRPGDLWMNLRPTA